MRVVAGRYGSRPLKAVPGMGTRPTTDKIKEAIFSSLGGYFEGGICLDFYGGSGGLAIEAVSRGMEAAVITEKSRPALAVIRENVAMTKEPSRFHILAGDNRQSLLKWQGQGGQGPFDLVLLDPPYAEQALASDLAWLKAQGLLGEATRIVCETDSRTMLPEILAGYTCYRDKTYGQIRVRYYAWMADEEEEA